MLGETALVTGASSGIGLELAQLLAAERSNLVLVARSEDALRTLADDLEGRHQIKAHVVPKDLAEPGAAEEIFETLQSGGVEVDVVVNNAGFGQRGAFTEIDLERQLSMIQLNVAALTALTGRFLPGMLQRRRGGILNVASTAGFFPGPYMAVYYATKAYVVSFSEALAEEVGSQGVTVTCLAPGATDTGFADEADMGGSRLFELGAMDARTVAEAGLNGFRSGEVLVVPGVQNKLSIFSGRLVPRAVARKVTKALQQ